MRGKSNLGSYLFFFSLIVLACTVRSGIIVDKSFLPRFLILNTLLLITVLIRFRKPFTPTNRWIEGGFILFYLWSLMSSCWSISPSEAILQSQLVFSGFALFILVLSLYKENPVSEIIFIRMMLVTLLFSYILAFYKIFSLEFYDPYKIISISANNNLYSGFLLLSLPLLIAGYSLMKGLWRYLVTGAGILSVFFIVIIQTRAAYLGFSVSSLLFLLITLLKFKNHLSKKNVLTGIIAILITGTAVFIFYSSLDPMRQNYFLSKVPVWNYFKSYETLQAEKAMRMMNQQQGDLAHMPEFDYAADYYENANLRLIFWKKSIGLISSHPLLGVGTGNWRLAVPSVKDPPNPEHTVKNYTYSQPHNEWIGIVSETGIIGMILAVFIFFLPPGIVIFRLFSTPGKTSFPSVVYASFLLGFYVYTIFDFPFHRIEHLVLLFSLMAFLVGRNSVPDIRKKSGYFGIPSVIISSGMIIFLGFSLLTGFMRFSGEYNTLKMFRVERKNDLQEIEYCRKAKNRFYQITPNALPVDWFEGVAQYRMGRTQDAVTCFEKAIKITPYEVRVLNDYGISLYSRGNVEKGKSLLWTSLYIDPYFDDAKFNLAAIHFLSRSKDSALYYVNRCNESVKKKEYLEELQKK